jgi:hypothetical protein
MLGDSLAEPLLAPGKAPPVSLLVLLPGAAVLVHDSEGAEHNVSLKMFHLR